MHVNVSATVKTVGGILYSMAESWKNLKDNITFSPFSMCLNQNKSALVHDLLSDTSQFVGQL